MIATQQFNLPVEGKVELDLKSLITVNGLLDVNSIKVIVQPPSGAIASIVNGVLSINYDGIGFIGKETIVVEACNIVGECSQQTFEIAVVGGCRVQCSIS